MKQLGGLHVKIWWVAILSHVKLGGLSERFANFL